MCLFTDYRPNIGVGKYQYRYRWPICLSKYIGIGINIGQEHIGIGWTHIGLSLTLGGVPSLGPLRPGNLFRGMEGTLGLKASPTAL